MSGGAAANKSGLSWEAWVKVVATTHGFDIRHVRERPAYHAVTPVEKRRVIWTQVPYETVYHNTKYPRKTSTEYVVECGEDIVRIECKWQSEPGSVDEKYPFMYLNAVLTMKEPTIVFALGGDYFESERGNEIRDWLRKNCAEPPVWFSEEVRASMRAREFQVLTINTFERWFRERFAQ